MPFGAAHRPSALEMAAAPENAPLWGLFLSIDPDKEQCVLMRWAEHVREERAALAPASIPSRDGANDAAAAAALQAAAADALHAWAAVNERARRALRRASIPFVQDIERHFLQFFTPQVAASAREAGSPMQPGAERQAQETDELVLHWLDDSFQRLVAHGLAEFYSLSSHTRQAPGGMRHAVVRQRREGSAAGTLRLSSTHGAGKHAYLLSVAVLRFHMWLECAMRMLFFAWFAGRRRSTQITCSDLLIFLADRPDNLSVAALVEAFPHLPHHAAVYV